MFVRPITLAVVTSLLGLALAACGGSNPEAPSDGPPAYATWRGAVTVPIDGKSGAFWVRATVTTTVKGRVVTQASTGTVDGVLTTVDGSTIALTGTLSRNSGVLSVQGGGYVFTATAASGGATLDGFGSFTPAAGSRTSTAALSLGPVAIGVSASVVTSGSVSQSYCGSYNGNYVNPDPKLNSTEQGPICFTIQGGRVYGSVQTSGEITPGSPSSLSFGGTATATSFFGVENGGRHTVQGDLFTKWTGSYSGSDGVGNSSGVWQAPGPSIPVPPAPSPPATIPPLTLGN